MTEEEAEARGTVEETLIVEEEVTEEVARTVEEEVRTVEEEVARTVEEEEMTKTVEL